MKKAEEIERLKSMLGRIPEPRDSQGKRHGLVDILFIALVAMVAGVLLPLLPCSEGLCTRQPMQVFQQHEECLPRVVRAVPRSLTTSLVVALCVFAGRDALAQPRAPEHEAPATKTPSGPKSLDGNLDFDLLGAPPAGAQTPSPLEVERLERAGRLRRRLLNTHQYLGLGLIASMVTTTVLGHLNYHDRFGGGGYTNRYNTAHLISALSTTGLFATNGILALAAPTLYEKSARWDTTRFHRIFMALATAGMVAEVVMGPISASQAGHLVQRDLARAHLGLGYATLGLLVAGALAHLF